MYTYRYMSYEYISMETVCIHLLKWFCIICPSWGACRVDLCRVAVDTSVAHFHTGWEPHQFRQRRTQNPWMLQNIQVSCFTSDSFVCWLWNTKDLKCLTNTNAVYAQQVLWESLLPSVWFAEGEGGGILLFVTSWHWQLLLIIFACFM